ncbi:SRPBCC family protein [Cytobacillus pseudoceanisediminis]|uniref:ATPase n=2 Tax=Cytobacillus TaxID=2675230 RepID=A0ABX3CTL6_9BACI|nr:MULTISPECIES: SRPBCC family protein [Cytobacillus]EFV76483.1 hsp90-like protein [Bacillus sp. 2_A_57_CT2]OHX48540.1 ATPase [Cytobacillus oceanisediminis]UQX55204.1 SRPBCC family protein [Cytobacillus pseudoceanisediminis]
MTNVFSDNRTDTASRVIMAEPQTIYQAFLNPKSLVSWLPPKGMSGHIDNFDPREGGTYNMTLTYEEDQPSSGKTSENTDVYQGKFLELVPDKRIVQLVIFVSESPDFTGEMIQKWLLESITEGTRVTIVCENVPKGIRKEDHDLGLKSTLENLAIFVE